MIRQILTKNHSHIKSLADAWLASGAKYYAILEKGVPVFEFPANTTQSLEIPVTLRSQIDSGVSLELRIPASKAATAQHRLLAEAGVLAKIFRLTQNLEGLTTELIDTQDQLLAIYNLTQGTRSHIELDKLLHQLAKETADLVKADTGFVIFDMPGELHHEAYYPEKVLDSVYSDLAFRTVQLTNQPYLSSEELSTKALVNFLVVPIQIRGETSAGLGFTKKTKDFMSPDLKLAQALADHSGAQIENLLLYKKNLDQIKLQTEIDLARQVQLNLLPQKPPEIGGLDVWVASRPALSVGGDFYDFHQKTNCPFSFTVGDISGKGLPAALLMSMTRTVIRSKANDSHIPTPGDIVSKANEELYDDFTDVNMFATVFVGQYDQAQRHMIYANAGHSPVIYRPVNSKPKLLEADGTALGVLRTCFSEDHEISFHPGDVLIVGTDGLNETQNEKHEMFGYNRLIDLIDSISNLPAEEIGKALYHAVSTFGEGQPQFDDQTLMVIKSM